MIQSPALSLNSEGKWHRGARLGLIGFTLFSWVGYGVFVKHPSLLAVSPLFPKIFSLAFGVFAQIHVLLCFILVAISLFKAQGHRWWLSFASVFAVCLLAELGGTTIGIPFGHYAYADLLGYKILGHVPVLIPMSWFAVAACAHALGDHLYPEHRTARVLITAFALVFWDLSLDPAMSNLFNYWVWTTKGTYYHGMPLVNLLGWFITGVTVGVCLELTEFRRELRAISAKEWINNYALIVALSVGFILLGGMWTAVAATGLAYGGAYLFLRAFFKKPNVG